MNTYIQKLIDQGENLHLDFKFQITDSKKIAKTLVAFANTEGGKLLIGVKDNGVIAGIRTDEEYYMVEAAAQMYCKPEIDFAHRTWNIEGKKILEVDIPPTNFKPVYAKNDSNKWLVYVRVKDQNILASTILIKYWQKENSKKGVFIKFSDTEKILLDFLEKNPFITIRKFCNIAGISKFKAEKIIVNLLISDVLEILMDEKKIWFRLKDPQGYIES